MNKLSKEKRDKLMLVGIATAGVLAALYLFLISPQQTALRDCADKTDATREKLAKAEHWLRMAPTIQTRLSACRKELDAKQDEMAPLEKFKWFYNTLERFLAQRSVKLADITREPEIGELGVLPRFPFQAATFGVKLNARYHDFGSFLAEFENQFPYMRVQNLDLEPDNGFKGNGKEQLIVEQRETDPESLAITMRVVTLLKPSVAL
jgi:hypothetical protein